MKVIVTPHARVVGLAVATALTGVAVGVYTLGRAQHDVHKDAAEPVAAIHVVARVQGQAPAKPKAPKPTPVSIAFRAGLPKAVARSFASHSTVAVSVFSSDSDVDRLTLKEAAAGARIAGVGFVPVDVSRKQDARALRLLTAKVGVVDTPALLVFTRGGKLAHQLEGFADRQIVAQASANAVADQAS
jgi:hypothetical protein